MNLFEMYAAGLPYSEFLDRFANEAQKSRWRGVYEQVRLTDEQQQLLRSFKRAMPILCLAGAWCGDCSGQCPIFEQFAAVTPVIQVRYLDRDVHAEVQQALQINGGNRVPVLVFFSEDGYEVSRYGERTLSKYRQIMRDQVGASCATGLAVPGDPLLAQVTHDWLDEFERVQWILRSSPRLRQKHHD
jgi:thiol-disulfide isomerase/thioredoxin